MCMERGEVAKTIFPEKDGMMPDKKTKHGG
jgi:hypothetical protein